MPLSVKDFDVALHVGYKSTAAKARYLAREAHKPFVNQSHEWFAGGRIFDSFLEA